MDIYIYPDLWKKLNKSGPKEDEPTAKPNEQGKYKPSDYAKVYETEKVKLADLPIYEKVNGKEVPVNKAIKFSVYNSTTQQHEADAVSADSKLKKLTLVRLVVMTSVHVALVRNLKIVTVVNNFRKKEIGNYYGF